MINQKRINGTHCEPVECSEAQQRIPLRSLLVITDEEGGTIGGSGLPLVISQVEPEVV